MILDLDSLKRRAPFGVKAINELEINGRNVDDEEEKTNYAADEDEPEATEDDTNIDDVTDDEPAEDEPVDYTAEQEPETIEEPAENDGPEATEDEPVDYTAEEPETTEDNEPAEDDANIDDVTDEGDDDDGEEYTDYTAEEPAEDTANGTGDEEPVNEPAEETDETGGDDSGVDTGEGYNDGGAVNNAAGGDEPVDYTAEEEPGNEDNTDVDTGDNADADGTDDGSSDTETGNESDNNDNNDSTDLKGLENDLFKDLTPQQMAIMNTELLQNYTDMYSSLCVIFDDINNIPKSAENTRVLNYISSQTTELKEKVNFIITTTYITRTYAENLVEYKRCLLMMSRINDLLQCLIQRPNNTDKDKD